MNRKRESKVEYIIPHSRLTLPEHLRKRDSLSLKKIIPLISFILIISYFTYGIIKARELRATRLDRSLKQ